LYYTEIWKNFVGSHLFCHDARRSVGFMTSSLPYPDWTAVIGWWAHNFTRLRSPHYATIMHCDDTHSKMLRWCACISTKINLYGIEFSRRFSDSRAASVALNFGFVYYVIKRSVRSGLWARCEEVTEATTAWSDLLFNIYRKETSCTCDIYIFSHPNFSIVWHFPRFFKPRGLR